ncbi:MAG TPA: exodeoxyribonuclease III [Kiritimatiellia bacterium]|nr:exodeoxyribonuclease III [Kiritimatiellia bacterium]HRZ12882.1 exodeoxyribonuclease III [Kiritimatiellia bacterium]HSA19458.1 exodeoxyribonuclease III [Kiritimatiellia bacterium]
MKIATFNANSIRSRLDVVLAWLKQHQPDILAVQETKVVDELFPREPIEAAGYRVAFRGQKAYNGVAIISKKPADEVRFGFDDKGPADETRLLHARFGKLHVVNTYVPQGREVDHPMYRYKIEWYARLRKYFDRHFTTRDRVIWLGDLNVARTPLDVHNPEERENHVCYHHAAREAFEQCLAWGFTDVFRKHHPEPGQYSFFDYRTPRAVDRGLGWRLDYILASPPLAKGSRDARIDLDPRRANPSSDHTFVFADIS